MTDDTEDQSTPEKLPAIIGGQAIGAFANLENFQNAQRMAQALVSSSLVPAQYQGKENLGNAVIALSMAQRIGADPMMVMQNLYVVHGKPAWSAQFVISAINSCGRFSPLRFDLAGDGDSRSCVAWVLERGSGDRLEGPPVSILTAKAEGWHQKKGSKWQTMPEVMLRYRAASFFGRIYAPDILMGMQTAEENNDVYDLAPAKVVNTDTGEVSTVYETRTADVADRVAQVSRAARGAADAENPEESTAEQWPQQISDEETGELRWADSAAQFFNLEMHSMSKDGKTPSVTRNGRFRARRGTVKQSEAEVDTVQDAQGGADSEAPMITADELADRAIQATTPEELDNIEDISDESLTDPAERNAVKTIILRKRTALAQ